MKIRWHKLQGVRAVFLHCSSNVGCNVLCLENIHKTDCNLSLSSFSLKPLKTGVTKHSSSVLSLDRKTTLEQEAFIYLLFVLQVYTCITKL